MRHARTFYISSQPKLKMAVVGDSKERHCNACNPSVIDLKESY